VRFDRNFLRQEIFPALAARWPGFPQRVAHSAAVLRRLAQAEGRLLGAEGEAAGPLALAELPPGLEERGDVLVRWLRHQGVRVRSRTQLLAFCAQLEAREDALPQLDLGGCTLRRWRSALWVAPRLPAPDTEGRPLAPGRWPFPGGMLEVREAEAGDEPFALAPGPYRVCQGSLPGRQRLQPDPARPHKTVKALLQEAAVPPWLRPYLPQLWAGDRFLGWPGVALAGGRPAGPQWVLRWHFQGLAEAKRVE
jgi:tRNA(Ile)-lysidine synthase